MKRISRRSFVATTLVSTGHLAHSAAQTEQQQPGPVRASDVRDYLSSLNGGWVNTERTVDTFKAGDPNAVVKGIAVGWMSYTWALREALRLGCNLFITHEAS
jgi:hypothetical protein